MKSWAIIVWLAVLTGQAVWSEPVPMANASFENATGYHAYGTAPTSWVSASNNIADTGGLTEYDSYVGQVGAGSALNKDGNNYLALSMEVGAVGIVGKTVTCWIPTVSLGTYQPNKRYTLTVAQAASTSESNRYAMIALAANGVIAVSKATAFRDLNLLGYIFQDQQVVLDTLLHPEWVGQSITVQLMQQATEGAKYSRSAVFDNVRLEVTEVPLIDIQNASFENATGERAEGTAPSSWLVATTNLIDSSDSTANDSYLEQVSNGTAANKDGHNFLLLSMSVGPVAIAGKTVTSWVSTDTLGIYAANHRYTLLADLSSLSNEPNRSAAVALAGNGQIAATVAVPFNLLNPSGIVENCALQVQQVVVDTTVQPELVGQAISVRLLQLATDGARDSAQAVFDNVRLEAVPVDPGGGDPGGGDPDAHPLLGMNLGGGGAKEAFVDLFKMGTGWVSQKSGQPWGTGPALDLDAHGWVRSLEPGCYAEVPLGVDTGGSEHFPAGLYTVLYEGEGTISFWPSGTARIVDSSQPNRLIIQVNSIQGWFWMTLSNINPANYLRNIHVIMPGFETTWQTNPWRPDFLQRWAGLACLRFMEWGWINNSNVVHWSERSTLDNAMNSLGGGIPLELMIDLCNRQHIQPWFCIPHQASDDYVFQFATMVRDQLDPTLKVGIEYSNEMWNSGFAQYTYGVQKADQLNLGEQTRLWEGACIFYAQRSVEIFQIFEEVFGGTDRLDRILSWQAAGSRGWFDDLLLANLQPGDVDALAVAPYMSFNVPAASSDPETPDASQVATWTVDQVLDYVEQTALPMSIGWMNNAKSVARDHGLKLYAYEAGQHLVGVAGGEANSTVTNLLMAANAHPRMGTLYTAYLHAWQNAGGDLLCAFTNMNPWNKWGSWGLLQYTDDDPAASPKFMAVMQWAKSLGQPVNVPSPSDPPAADFASWATLHSVGPAHADDDRDGIKNGIEYAFGLDPHTPNADSTQYASLKNTGVGIGSHLTFTCRRPAPADLPADVSIEVRFSNDLINWTTGLLGTTYTEEVSGGNPPAVTVTLIPALDTYRFARLAYIIAP